MRPSKETGINWAELGRTVKEVLLEPITFAKELRKRMGYNSPLVLLPPAIPIVSGFSIAIHHDPILGIAAGVAEWIAVGVACRSIRKNNPSAS